MKKQFLYISLLLLLASCSKFNRVQKRGTTEQKYQAAIRYFEKKDYYRASVLFEEVIPLLKGTEQAEKAQYYYAYSQYYQSNLILAANYFKRFSETFPRSEFKEDAMYMHARSLFEDVPKYSLDQSNAYEAMKSIQSFLNAFPKTEHLDDCNFMMDIINGKLEKKTFNLSKSYYRQRHYKAAVVALDNFRKGFPKSDFSEEVSLMILDSKYHYANNSLDEKKKERYEAALAYYQDFVDEFPNGKLLPKAEAIFVACQEKLNKIQQQTKK